MNWGWGWCGRRCCCLRCRCRCFRRCRYRNSDTEDEVVEQVCRTVIHEVAHHFGINVARLDELGW
jgi:predicted Zn-dependent protease with MMP-like domain